MSTIIHRFPVQHSTQEGAFIHSDPNMDPEVMAKLEELQAWTICYNRELLRLTRELSELRRQKAKAA